MFIADAVTGHQRPHTLTVQPCPRNTREIDGVYGAGHADGQSYWGTKSRPGDKRRVPADGYPSRVVEALTASYDTFAHLVSYVMRDADGAPLAKAPRLNKTASPDFDDPTKKSNGFDYVRSLGYGVQYDLAVVDVDCHMHAAHNATTVRDFIAQMTDRPEIDGAIWYFTLGGIRVIFMLPRAHTDADTFEKVITAAIDRVNSLKLVIDGHLLTADDLRDHSRFMGLPDVLRVKDKVKVRVWEALAHFNVPMVYMGNAHVVDLGISNRPKASSRQSAPKPSTPRRARPIRSEPLPEDGSIEVPNVTPKMLDDVAAKGVQRHQVFLAIPEAMLKSGVEAEYVTAITREIHVRSGFDPSRVEETVLGTERTIENWRNGQSNIGLRWLRTNAPEIARAVTMFSLGKREKAARAKRSSQPEHTPVKEAMASFLDTVRDACAPLDKTTKQRVPAYGRHIHAAPPGAGKSEAIVTVAAEEAACGNIVSIATLTRRNGVDIVARLAKLGIPTYRLHSPTSERWGVDGEYVCHMRDLAVALQAGGHDVRKELCRGHDMPGKACHKAMTCPGAQYGTGSIKSLVWIGTHAALSQLVDRDGGNVLLDIDESPDPNEIVEITDADLALLLRELPALYHEPYHLAMSPFVHALRQWLKQANDQDTTLQLAGVCPAEDLEAVESIAFGKKKTFGVPLSKYTVDPSELTRIGKASRFLKALWRATFEESLLMVDDHRSRKAFLVLHNVGFQRAGAVTRLHIFDADAKARLQTITAALPHEQEPKKSIELHETFTADGAPVERVFIYAGKSSRSDLLPAGKVTADSGWIEILEQHADLFQERPAMPDVLIITYKPLALAMRLADLDRRLAAEGHTAQLVAEHEVALAAWADAGQTRVALVAIVEAVRPVLDRFTSRQTERTARVAFLHYGGTRGVDDFKGWSTATIGEHVDNLGAVKAARIFRGLPIDADSLDEAIETSKTAESGQAHGRARPQWITSPITCAHAGTSMPAGWEGRVADRSGPTPLELKIDGGKMGAEHGHLGGKFGHLGKDFGHLGAEHGVKGGRPKAPTFLPVEEFKAAWELLKLSGLIAATGKSRQVLTNYRDGQGIPKDVAEAIRDAVEERRSIVGQVGRDDAPVNDVCAITLDVVDLDPAAPENDTSKRAC